MELKIKKSGYETWDIYYKDKIVGTIDTFSGMRTNTKYLYVGEKQKQLSSIKNQKEATEKLLKFFEENKIEIDNLKNTIVELNEGINQVTSTYCKTTLEKERELVINKLNTLEELNLI